MVSGRRPGFLGAPPSATSDWEDLAIAGGVAAAAFVVAAPFAAVGLDPHHDGIMLKPALDVAAGQVLFRDTFSQYGPLTTWLHALVLRISPGLLGLKLATVGADSLALGIFYLVWRSILPRSLALLSALMFLLLNPVFDAKCPVQPWSSDVAMLFQAVAWLALVRTIDGTRPVPWAILLGGASAAAFWCRQPVGLSLIGTLAVVAAGLLVAGWRGRGGGTSGWVAILAAVGGLAAASGLVLGYLWGNDALSAWWLQNIVWPRRWAMDAGTELMPRFSRYSLPPVRGGVLAIGLACALAPPHARRRWPGLPGWVDWSGLGFAIVAAAALGMRSVRVLDVQVGGWRVVLCAAVTMLAVSRLVTLLPRFAPSRPPDYCVSAALAAVALASLTQFYPMPCQRHAFWALAPAAGVAVYALWRVTDCDPRLLAATLLLALPTNAWSAFESGRSKMRAVPVTLAEPQVLLGIRVDAGAAASVRHMADILGRMERSDPARPFVLIGNDALPLACVGNRRNLSPYFVTWPGLMPAEAEAAWWERFASERPFLVLETRPRNPLWSAASAARHDYAVVAETPDGKLVFLAPAEAAVMAAR